MKKKRGENKMKRETGMKPILFSTPMVKAILENRKTMTRRVIRPRYRPGETGFVVSRGLAGTTVSIVDEDENTTREESPKYWPGDILYVRETWQENTIHSEKDRQKMPYLYRADPDGVLLRSWKPSIHMPREAARLFLEVKAVRIERLRDITEEDAKAEGVAQIDPFSLPQIPNSLIAPGGAYGKGFILQKSYRAAFYQLWDSLNAKRVDAEKKPVYSWENNPWVWVIEFERAKR